MTRAEVTLPSLVSFSMPIERRIADSSDLSCLPKKEETVLQLSVSALPDSVALSGCIKDDVSDAW